MEIDDYQYRAMTTAMPTALNMQYMAFNMMSELGEFMGYEAKAVRDNDGLVPEEKELLQKKELGDMFWQLAGMAEVKGWSLDEVAQLNLEKLGSRASRGVIGGAGDER